MTEKCDTTKDISSCIAQSTYIATPFQKKKKGHEHCPGYHMIV